MLKSHTELCLLCAPYVTLNSVTLHSGSECVLTTRFLSLHNSADIPLFWPHHHLQVFRLPLPHPLTTSWLCAVHLDHCGVCPLQRGVCTKAYLLVDLCCTQTVSPPWSLWCVPSSERCMYQSVPSGWLVLYTDGQPTLIIAVCALFREVYVPKHTFWLTCAVHRWSAHLFITSLHSPNSRVDWEGRKETEVNIISENSIVKALLLKPRQHCWHEVTPTKHRVRVPLSLLVKTTPTLPSPRSLCSSLLWIQLG